MKRSIVLISLIGILAACGPVQPAGMIASPTTRPAPTLLPTSPSRPEDQLEADVMARLAGNLGIRPAEISVVSDQRAQFNDTCLGVSLPDVPCAQAATPGRIVVLEAQGISFEYHASQDGAILQPASLALSWQREGGIAGFCDRLVVFRSGEVYGYRCASEGRMGTVASLLGPQEQEKFSGWVRQFGRVQIDASDPKGVADRMVVLVSFEGVGNVETALEADEQELLQFAQSLHERLPGQTMPQ